MPQVDRSRGFPLLRFRDRESYAGNKTKEYDDLAMRYFSYVLYPLVACFAIYSLIYERHKSWYSWILSSLTSCVYTFGKHLGSFVFHGFLYWFAAVVIWLPAGHVENEMWVGFLDFIMWRWYVEN